MRIYKKDWRVNANLFLNHPYPVRINTYGFYLCLAVAAKYVDQLMTNKLLDVRTSRL